MLSFENSLLLHSEDSDYGGGGRVRRRMSQRRLCQSEIIHICMLQLLVVQEANLCTSCELRVGLCLGTSGRAPKCLFLISSHISSYLCGCCAEPITQPFHFNCQRLTCRACCYDDSSSISQEQRTGQNPWSARIRDNHL